MGRNSDLRDGERAQIHVPVPWPPGASIQGAAAAAAVALIIDYLEFCLPV